MLASILTPPPLPPWPGMHPLVVHFPIALLLVAPLFIVLGLAPRVGRYFRPAALALLILGTTAAYVAAEAGEAAAALVTQTAAIAPVLHEHAELAERVELLFTLVTAAYAAVLLVPPLLRKLGVIRRELPHPAPLVAQIVVLLGALASGLVLANTGHLGGRLVHELGVQAFFGG